jgi:betaine-aldehyde dehydrogenase
MSVLPEIDRRKLFIGGGWAETQGGAQVEVHNPANQDLVGLATLASPEDASRAVAAARRSFDEGTWRRMPAAERATVMEKAAGLLEQRLERGALLVTSELGCTLGVSRAVQIPTAIRHLRYYADMISSFEADEVREDAVNRSIVTQEPVGVVAVITPWNGPVVAPMVHIAPALAAGCSVVVKPSPETPLSLYEFADGLQDAGLPPGVLNIVPAGRETGAHLVSHPGVDKVAFTGSTAAGKAIIRACAGHMARLTLELGGKSAAVVLPDANLDAFAGAMLTMALSLSGQACVAQTRVLAPRSCHDAVVESLAETFRKATVGDPLDPGTQLGPLISSAQRDRVEGYIASGRADGAQVVVGGDRPHGLDDGWYINPTLFDQVDNHMRIAREEIFGPVISVIAYQGVDEAVSIANDSPFGLAGSVFGNQEEAMAIARRIRTGWVSINGHPQAYGSPLGGFKESGLGRALGPEGLRSYFETKAIAVGPRP